MNQLSKHLAILIKVYGRNWKKKQITREQLFEERFHTFFKNYYQLEINGNSCSDQYLSYLAYGHEEVDGAIELLTDLFSAKK